ncbi:MAG: enoyl-CoA hydratase/isomerase family protein [Candidatus Hodarchaeales archaeon]|jgi:2-(1,2-epoxy-1,2-dihydrophenyl)acetyl-CoA isomerase
MNGPSNNNSTNEESTNTVLFNVKDHIASITINRPKKMNALRFTEFDGINKYVKQADNDPNVHVIRLCSSGDRAFSGGLDLNMLQQFTPEDIPKLLEYGNNTVLTFLKAKKPIVVQVQGPAVAWGAILCLASDFVMAGYNPKTFFSLPEIDIGLFPATGALTTTLLNCGYRQAKRILMIPEKITLNMAELLGIVQTCPIDKLEEETIEFCQNLASKPQEILIPTKALINNFHFKNIDYYLEKEAKAIEVGMKNGEMNRFDDFIKSLWKI